MAVITLELQSESVAAAIGRLAAFRKEALPGAFIDIGEYLLISHRERAEREVDPGYAKWAPLDPGYKRWKERKRPGVPILKFDFHMLGDRFTYQIDGDDLYLGTSAIYGPRQNRNRQFLGLSTDDEVEVVALLGDHYERALDGPETPTA